MHSGNHRTGSPTLRFAGFFLPGMIVLAACSDSLSLQAMDGPRPASGPISSPELAPTADSSPVDEAGLRISIVPGEGEWTFRATAIDDSSYSIHVTDDHGRPVQSIDGLVSRPPFATNDLLDIRDYNADGYPDILARTLPVGASAITGGSLYVFHPDSRAFIESDGIDQEGDIAIEPNGCVSVEYRSDAMNYRKDHYCWRSGRWEFQRTTRG